MKYPLMDRNENFDNTLSNLANGFIYGMDERNSVSRLKIHLKQNYCQPLDSLHNQLVQGAQATLHLSWVHKLMFSFHLRIFCNRTKKNWLNI